MSHNAKRRIALGPGEIAVNRQRFFDAEEVLADRGHTVLNPMRHEGKADSWAGYMRLCIPDVAQADGICLLPRWEDSPGAKVEHDLAVALRLADVPL